MISAVEMAHAMPLFFYKQITCHTSMVEHASC